MKGNKGISLIVLVITIIVIIILAGAVILSLVDNNPIAQANAATFKANVSEYNSELAMAVSCKYLQDNSFNPSTFNAGTWNGGSNTVEGTVKEYITCMTTGDAAKFEIQNSKLVYVGTDEIEKNWLAEMEVAIGEPTPPVVTGLGVNVIATENTTVNGEAATYSNPIIPKGFKAINDGTTWPTDWNSGLVIEDESGNQFVWIPVDGTSVPYAKWCTTGKSYDLVSDDTLPSGVINEQEQINNYCGFYIARYEIGNSSNIAVSKKGIAVLTDITYANSKTLAEAMYTTTEVKSGLLTGKQWDTVMKWLQNSGKNVTDSRTWGNHSDSQSPANVSAYGSKQVTRCSEYWKANNIYDLAGNVWEWTNEIYGSDRVFRGGGYDVSGSTGPAAYRNCNTLTFTFSSVGFRSVLYIM
jgi:Tfp pilus assembly protein PilE